MQRRLFALLIPEGAIVLLAAGLLQWDALVEPVAPALPVFVYVIFGAGAVLAWRFGWGRALLVLAILVLAQQALHSAPAGSPLAGLTALLLPINLVVLAALPERGVLAPATMRRALAVLAQVGLVLLLVRPDLASLRAPIEAPLLPAALTAWWPLGDAALLAFAVAAAVLVTLIIRRPEPLTRGFLWAVVAGWLALSAHGVPFLDGGPSRSTLLLATAGLVLLTGMVEASHALAYRDGLTGLPSRRALDEALRQLEGPATVAMIDVDHFKEVNDRHGHEVGDQVLRMVATTLDAVGAGGRVFRYGGEEFAVLFPGKTLDEAVPALEAIRTAVEAEGFALRAPDRPKQKPTTPRRRSDVQRLTVTVSIGVATRAADHPVEAMVKAADEALYRAKQAGRNRLFVGGRGRRPSQR